MSRSIIVSLSAVLLLVLAVCTSTEATRVRAAGVRLGTNPGILVRVKKHALDKVFEGCAKLAETYAHRVPIPDVSATVSGVTIEAKELKISHFVQPQIKYTLQAPNRIVGSIDLPSVGVQGPFNATRATFVNKQHDSGLIIFNASQVHVSFEATLGESENGFPSVATFECTANLGPANLNVRNCKEKFAVEVLGLAAKSFRPIYNSQVCSTAKRLLTNQLNRLLAKIPNVLELNRNCAVKYQIRPQVAADHIQVGLFAKVLTEHVNPAQPQPFVESPAAAKSHVTVLISDQVLDEIAYHAYKNGKLNFKVNNESNALLYSLVQLQCDDETEACLGSFVPSLAHKYGPNARVELALRAKETPQIDFIPGKATFKVVGEADLSVTPANGTRAYHDTTVTANIAGALKIRILEGRVYAKAEVEQLQVLIDGEFNEKYTEKLRQPVQHFVDDTVNAGLLMRGLPLHLPFGASLREPKITFNENTLQADTGFDYEPQASGEVDGADGRRH